MLLLFLFLLFSLQTIEACMRTMSSDPVKLCTSCAHNLAIPLDNCPYFNDCNQCSETKIDYGSRTPGGCTRITVTCPNADTPFVLLNLSNGMRITKRLTNLGTIRCDNAGRWLYSLNTEDTVSIRNLTCFHMPIQAQQSPIDLQTASVIYNPSLTTFTQSYVPGEDDHMTIGAEYHGFTIFLKEDAVSSFSATQLDGYTYTLRQMHAHWGDEISMLGSEHRVDGKQYVGELHLVHWNSQLYPTFVDAVGQPNGIAVIGIFLTIGAENVEFDKITSTIADEGLLNPNDELEYEESLNFDFTKVFPASKDFWTYTGGLTTPDYNTCVQWTVMREPITVSETQMEVLYNLYEDNFRDPQPILTDVHSNFQI